MDRKVSSWSVVVVALTLLGGAPARADERPLPPVLMTEFDPLRDGLPFANVGDSARPGGNCWGMSLLAIDNYMRRLDRGREGERALVPDTFTSVPHLADPTQQATVGLLQATVSKLDFSDVPVEAGRRLPLSDPTPVREALDRIGQTGAPEVLVIRGPQGAHAVVLYGYDGALRIYDPNFPGESIRWPWDPVTGFGPHPKGSEYAFYAGLTHASTTPYETHRTADAMERLREACATQDGSCTGRYPTLGATFERAPDGSVVVTGQAQATDGKTPGRVWLAVNGQPIGSAEVSRFGTFRAVVPPGALVEGGDNVVRVIGETTSKGWAQFAGFADLPLTTPPTAQAPETSLRPRPRPVTSSRRPVARPEGLGQSRGLGAVVDATHE